MKLTQINEEAEELVLEQLQFKRDEYSPVLSEENINIHYGKLAKGYVDRYNTKEGDAEFNYAGAFLHNIYFPQLKSPTAGKNNPYGASLTLINKKHGSFEDLQMEITKQAMKIQGSGWVYMARDGEVKTITNHQVKHDIALLIDWWEHAWFPDYGSDKAKYLTNIWRCIDWDYVNARINT